MSGDGTPAEAPGDHLTPAARAAVGLHLAERIRMVRAGSWIPYRRANAVRRKLQWALTQEPSARMTGLTLAGPTNNGKSTIVRAFIDEARTQARDAGAEAREFLYIETPPLPHPTMLYSEILRAISDSKADKGTASAKRGRVLHVLPQLGLRMIFLDEIQNVMAASARQADAFLACMKGLSNTLRVPIVLIGTEDATTVIKSDPQVENRYPPTMLPAWEEGEEFLALVRAVLSTFPLRRKPQLSKAAVNRLYRLSKGSIGGVVQVLQLAAATAIETETELIDSALIDALEP